MLNKNARRHFLCMSGMRVTRAVCLGLGFSNVTSAHSKAKHEPAKGKLLPLILPQELIDLKSLESDISTFLVSEKLDGVRAYWDGHQLFFRSGRLISVPTWFTKSFPAHPWDGELWMGRGSFEQLSAIVRRQNPSDSEWQKVKYNLFELPEGAGDFHQRIERLRAEIAELNVPWVTLIPQQSLDSVDHLILQLKNAVAEKAEGLVLHKMDAQFESGRSDKVFKLKPQFDAEAKVLAIEIGTGKLQGMMGALLIETMDGKRFWLGTGFKLEHRKNPPQLDSWITYRYRDINSNGLPKFASFLRVYHTE